MVSINHDGLGLPETRFDGIKGTGTGVVGGAYLVQKFARVNVA